MLFSTDFYSPASEEETSNKKLHEADTAKIVNKLLSEGADVNNLNSSGKSPLHSALMAGRELEVVKALLSAGANVNAKIRYRNYSVLHLAQTEEIIKELLSHGADINAVNNQEETPLHTAVAVGRELPVINALLSAGVNVNGELAFSKLTALHLAKTENYVNELISQGADANAVNSFQGTPLHFAISNNRGISVIKALLSGGANPNAMITGTKQTPLHIATTEEIVNELLANGADTNKKDINGETPLHLAVQHSRVGIIKSLLSSGADVNAVDNSDNSTPLHYAETAEIVNLLLSYDANVNALDFNGETPLVSALYADVKPGVVKLLLNAGAEVRGHKVLHKCSCPEIASLLISYGADVDDKDQDQNSALHAVLESKTPRAIDVGRLLLKYGADVTTKNALGVSPIDSARESNDEMVIELLKYGAKYKANVFLHCIDANTEISKTFVKLFVLTHYDVYQQRTVCNQILCRSISSLCASCLEWTYFMKKCDQEIIEMKKYMILPHFSLFNLVTTKPVKLLRFVKIQIADIVVSFPIYKDIIEEALRLSLERTLLFDTFIELSLCSLSERSGDHVVLNLDCMNCIAAYLKDYEILKFITSMNSSKYKSKI